MTPAGRRQGGPAAPRRPSLPPGLGLAVDGLQRRHCTVVTHPGNPAGNSAWQPGRTGATCSQMTPMGIAPGGPVRSVCAKCLRRIRSPTQTAPIRLPPYGRRPCPLSRVPQVSTPRGVRTMCSRMTPVGNAQGGPVRLWPACAWMGHGTRPHRRRRTPTAAQLCGSSLEPVSLPARPHSREDKEGRRKERNLSLLSISCPRCPRSVPAVSPFAFATLQAAETQYSCGFQADGWPLSPLSPSFFVRPSRFLLGRLAQRIGRHRNHRAATSQAAT